MNFWSRLKAGARGAATPAAGESITQPYTMERTGEDSAEIVLYGDIVSERPIDWRTGKPSEEAYIVLSEFLEDLKQVEDVARLTVRIHSVGGNAYDSLAIHNRLKSLNADITVIVDGVAMSGGSLIMCAGGKVQVYPSSLIMIHRCWAFIWGGYNAAELRKMADGYDAADRSQAAIYHIKTGIDTQELLDMMEAETYMTGQEAISKGFADELVEGSDGLEVAASADRRTLLVGGRPVWASTSKSGIPAAIPTVNPGNLVPIEINRHQPAQTGGQNGGNTMANTLDELKTENPTLAEQLMAEARAAVSASGAAAPNASSPAATPPTDPASNPQTDPVAAERQRIQDIDVLAGIFDTETINAAKYGDTACTAQEMVYRAAQKASQQGRKFLAALEGDTAASGAQQVGAAAGDGGEGDDDTLTPAQLMAKGRADAKALTNPEKEEK
ncbi:head maturation protease, ClpP-related [Anaeromassilibacillus senegalensis]|uniref:head maturation protease, ClpP-related n=1 Tax=Anaeromassilibacillus senegalensis TaxID=1673717 RepID=UPI0006804717|nr:head maturation protease, ClpP-related [Anaeromassilibacillus senegalensis]